MTREIQTNRPPEWWARFFFRLAKSYDTDGVPADLIWIAVQERGCDIDEEIFHRLLMRAVRARNGLTL